jgi:hypothetical protein
MPDRALRASVLALVADVDVSLAVEFERDGCPFDRFAGVAGSAGGAGETAIASKCCCSIAGRVVDDTLPTLPTFETLSL